MLSTSAVESLWELHNRLESECLWLEAYPPWIFKRNWQQRLTQVRLLKSAVRAVLQEMAKPAREPDTLGIEVYHTDLEAGLTTSLYQSGYYLVSQEQVSDGRYRALYRNWR